MTRLQNPWDIFNKDVEASIPYIHNEQDRWLALLEEPLGMLYNPLKYGELTLDGYIKARNNRHLQDHQAWPKEPVAIAQLLVAIGIKPDDIGYATMAHEHMLDGNNVAPLATLLAIYKSLHTQLNKEISVDDLLSTLEGYNWGYSYFDDYRYACEAIKAFLPTVVEQERFLTSWLPTVKASHNAYSIEESPGLAIASIFNEVHPASIVQWCKDNDDQVGLGYLICQERFSFSEWLVEVAEPSSGTRARGSSESYADYNSHRRIEQFDTLNMLIKHRSIDKLRAEGQEFATKHPDECMLLLDRFVEKAPKDINILWCFALMSTAVVSPQNPRIIEWFDTAHKAQTEIIAQLGAGTHTMSSLDILPLGSPMHYKCGPEAHKISENAREFLARDLVLRSRRENSDGYLLSMPDKEWLRDTSIAPALSVVIANSIQASTVALTAAFYPYLRADEKPMFATYLFEMATRHVHNCNDITAILSKVAPEVNPAVLSTKPNGLSLLMFQLTGKDPAPLIASLNALDIDQKDESALHSMRHWLELNSKPQSSGVAIPQDLDGDALGVFADMKL